MLKTKILNAQTNECYEQTLLSSDGREECLIGRHATCDLVLDSPEVSRVHGRVMQRQGQYYFTDLGSTDGSRLNNEAVQINRPYPLKSEDTLRIGNFVLWVETLGLNGKLTYPIPVQQDTANSGFPQPRSQGDISVRCVQIIDETHDVKTFRFVAEPTILFDYQPGQFVTLKLNIDGRPVQRSYSISSSASRPHTLDITVKRVPAPADTPDAPPGLVSNWLHDHLTVGATLSIKGPLGKFTCLNAPADKLLFISAGSGITPMMSMAQWLCDTVAGVDMIFLHSARSPQDIIFQQQLQVLAARHPNFRLAITVTRPVMGQPWFGYTGRLNPTLLQAIAPDFRDRAIYVCGPNPFMDATKAMVQDLDFSMQQYFSESFGPARKPKSKTAAAANSVQVLPPASLESCDRPPTNNIPPSSSPPLSHSSAPAVIFANSGKETPCDAEDSLLDVAEQVGVDLPSGCRMGVCGACKCKVIEGEVTYEEDPNALDDAERQQGIALACVATPVGRVVLEA